MEKPRFHEIDFLKAVSILTVVLIHSLRPPWISGAHPLEIWLSHAISFAVPAFVAASGFLWAGDFEGDASYDLPRKIRRLLAPYLCVSLAVQASRALVGRGLSLEDLLYDLALASTYDLYYYVFIAVIFALAAPLFAKIPRAMLTPVAILLVGATLISQGLFSLDSSHSLSFAMYSRNPLLFGGHFAVGWLARTRYARLRTWIAAERWWMRGLLVASAATSLAIAAVPLPIQATMAAHWEYQYTMVTLLFVTGCGNVARRPLIHMLSDATYAIFLVHPVFIALVDRAFPSLEAVSLPLSIAVRFGVGLLGSILVIYVARRAAPGLSRDLIGA